MRDNYEVIKAKVSASCKYYASYYELEVWFKGDDTKERGTIRNIGMYEIKELAGVKRGDGFKKIQAFLDIPAGMQWLEKTLFTKDLENEMDSVKSSIMKTISEMGLPDLIEFDTFGKNLMR